LEKLYFLNFKNLLPRQSKATPYHQNTFQIEYILSDSYFVGRHNFCLTLQVRIYATKRFQLSKGNKIILKFFLKACFLDSMA